MNRDSMLGQNHDVYHEFPEFADQIDVLKETNQEIARLVDEYTFYNREVIKVEQHIKPLDHFSFEDLKKRRLLSKDQLYALLNKQ